MSSRREFRLPAFAAKLRGLLRGRQRDDEFDGEIHEHLRLLAERFVAQGMSRQEAATAARRQFGNTTLLQQDRRELQTLPSIEAWWHDLRYSLRKLWRSRGFAAVSIATLGLGIGAAAAIFSVVYNVLLEPFPEKEAERMVFARIHNVQQSPGVAVGITQVSSGLRASPPPRAAAGRPQPTASLDHASQLTPSSVGSPLLRHHAAA